MFISVGRSFDSSYLYDRNFLWVYMKKHTEFSFFCVCLMEKNSCDRYSAKRFVPTLLRKNSGSQLFVKFCSFITALVIFRQMLFWRTYEHMAVIASRRTLERFSTKHNFPSFQTLLFVYLISYHNRLPLVKKKKKISCELKFWDTCFMCLKTSIVFEYIYRIFGNSCFLNIK